MDHFLFVGIWEPCSAWVLFAILSYLLKKLCCWENTTLGLLNTTTYSTYKADDAEKPRPTLWKAERVFPSVVFEYLSIQHQLAHLFSSCHDPSVITCTRIDGENYSIFLECIPSSHITWRSHTNPHVCSTCYIKVKNIVSEYWIIPTLTIEIWAKSTFTPCDNRHVQILLSWFKTKRITYLWF